MHFKSFMAVAVLLGSSCLPSCKGQVGNSSERLAKSAAAPAESLDAYGQLISSAASALRQSEFGLAVMQAGLDLEGTPYVAGMLDETDQEDLVIRLDGFDCVLLVESAVAAARAAAVGDSSIQGYAREIETLRYRNGHRDGYGSRLHYFTDWIANNEDRGIVEEVTVEAGGRPYVHELNFMSTNRSLYPKIADNDSLYSIIVDTETELRERDFFFIPQAEIADAYQHIQAGDIIAITTSVAGLDISHTGIAYVKDGKVGFLHASTSAGVTVAPDLSTYVNGNSKQTGIMVARPLTPQD